MSPLLSPALSHISQRHCLYIIPLEPAVVYIHNHMLSSLTSLCVDSNIAVTSTCAVHRCTLSYFPVPLKKGSLHCLDHMMVLVCGGSFLMRGCCLTPRHYSNCFSSLFPFTAIIEFSCHTMHHFLIYYHLLFQMT